MPRCVAAPMSDSQRGGAIALPLLDVGGGHGIAMMQRPVERRDQVIGFFETYRQPNQSIETVALQLLWRREVFGHGAMMIDLRRQSVKRQRIPDDHRGGEHVSEVACS